MSKLISINTLKNNIKNKPDSIALLLRTIPFLIGYEKRTTNNKTVIERLTKVFNMVSKLSKQQ